MAVTRTNKTNARERSSSTAKRVSVTEIRRRDNVAKSAGGPRDKALYKCSCGNEFEAAVSTSVECPHCGTGQAW